MNKILTALSLTALSISAIAADSPIALQLKKMGFGEVEVKPSPIKGVQTVVSSAGVFYATEDGKYILQGKLFEITDKGVVDVTNKELLEKLNALKSEMIVYPAKNEKHVVTVFFDITCHYCHKLHEQLKEYNDLGITVRYLGFPRNGMDSKAAKQMEAIFTSKDPVFALNEAENGNLPKELKEAAVVKKHYELGGQFGVQGTPTIITSSGEVIGGYLPPKELLEALETQ